MDNWSAIAAMPPECRQAAPQRSENSIGLADASKPPETGLLVRTGRLLYHKSEQLVPPPPSNHSCEIASDCRFIDGGLNGRAGSAIRSQFNREVTVPSIFSATSS